MGGGGERGGGGGGGVMCMMVMVNIKLQALVDILPSTSAVFSYAIGSRNCQLTSSFVVVAQTVVSLLQKKKKLRLYQTFV